MTSDKELLELAAKSANMGKLDFDYPEREGHDFDMGPRLPMPTGVLMAATHTYWNPLTDDGDALRLAVNLQLEHYFGSGERGTMAFCGYPDKDNRIRYCSEPVMTDPCAATRRAIVRAAAELGKAMP